MGNIQVKVCEPPTPENGYNCASVDRTQVLGNGYCIGKNTLKSNIKWSLKSPSEWNGDTGFICASGFEAQYCGSGGCSCKATENCGKLAIIPMIIFFIIAIIVIYISIMSYAAAKGDIGL